MAKLALLLLSICILQVALAAKNSSDSDAPTTRRRWPAWVQSLRPQPRPPQTEGADGRSSRSKRSPVDFGGYGSNPFFNNFAAQPSGSNTPGNNGYASLYTPPNSGFAGGYTPQYSNFGATAADNFNSRSNAISNYFSEPQPSYNAFNYQQYGNPYNSLQDALNNKNSMYT